MKLDTLAHSIAKRAHAEQTRRDGTPYIVHPERVAYRLIRRYREVSDEILAAAYLHDVLEDTSESPGSLRAAGIPDRVIQIVETLTRKDGVPYVEYIAQIRKDPLATAVKVEDMLDNLADDPSHKQIRKYAAGLLSLIP